MLYEDLLGRYGSFVSMRVQHDLTPSEFEEADVADLPEWLESRAQAAHEEYRRLLSNPLSAPQKGAGSTREACRRWRDAEDLAYFVAVADDVELTAMAG